MITDGLLEMWTREEMDKEPHMDQEKETQANKKISHSIDEILTKPTCVRREARVLRNWSVIKENNQVSNLHLYTGKFLSLNVKSQEYNHTCTPVNLKCSLCQQNLHSLGLNKSL